MTVRSEKSPQLAPTSAACATSEPPLARAKQGIIITTINGMTNRSTFLIRPPRSCLMSPRTILSKMRATYHAAFGRHCRVKYRTSFNFMFFAVLLCVAVCYCAVMSRQIHISFWGVRGSVPAPGRSTTKYGGNTSCVTFRYGDTLIICDAGTGIRPLGHELLEETKKSVRATILLSHLHWDHFMGLPFFEPLYHERNKFIIAGPSSGGKSFKRLLSNVMQPPYFPITPEKFTAHVDYRSIKNETFRIYDIKVEPFSCHHPDGSFGWKFIFPNGKRIIHVTDNEPSLRNREQMVEWMRDADMIIHDAQFSPATYAHHRGWGHSPHTYPVEMAILARARRLFLFHFDPAADDRELDRRLKDAREIVGKYHARLHVHLAREGKTIAI